MRVCFFGSYLPEYSRNKILIDGLEKNNVKIFHCRSSKSSFINRYLQLMKQYWKIKNRIDVIFVAFVGQLDVPLAWFLARLTHKKVVFDMFYSMYDTYVFDRQSAKPGSLRALTYWWIDKIAATLADKIITDTNAHANYFQKLFKLSPQKFHRVFVGGDDTIFKPLIYKRKRHIIKIEFHGMFTRLHGAEYFVDAAKKLEKNKKLNFYLIGSTANYSLPIQKYVKLKPSNMSYYERMLMSDLANFIAGCDITIGHLGTTMKAKCVITNKIFHALNSRVAVIVGDCPASRELFEDKKNALFVKMGDTKDLINKIELLAKNNALRNKIAENGYQLSKNLTNIKLGKELLVTLKN